MWGVSGCSSGCGWVLARELHGAEGAGEGGGGQSGEECVVVMVGWRLLRGVGGAGLEGFRGYWGGGGGLLKVLACEGVAVVLGGARVAVDPEINSLV
jgi:hypothetical protein